MAEIPVTRKSSSSMWMWLLGALVLAALAWILIGSLRNDPEPDRTAAAPSTTAPMTTTDPAATTAPTATTDPAVAVLAPPPTTPQAGDAPATMGAAATSTGGTITDTGAYASAGDKLALVGRSAEFTNARVTAVVGPNTFRIATGGEDLYVMLAVELSGRGVGTQGNIDAGSTLTVTGSFQRLTSEEISDIANSRFRDLTEAGRAVLRDRQVYLNATSVSKIS